MMAQDGLVSVILPVYNGERFVRAALDSVLAQTYRPIEVIVVNDGSTDGSEAILKEYGDRIRYIMQKNAGPAAATNRGIAEARGEWIAFQHADDLWAPDKIEDQLLAAQADDAVVDCRMRVIDESGHVVGESWRPFVVGSPPLTEWMTVGCRASMSALVRRRAVQAVDGFDSANRLGTDDYQFWLALVATGHRFRFIDKVLASYRRHGGNVSSNTTRMLCGDIYALEQTRRKYPRAFGKAEMKAYHERLYEVHSDVAWMLYNPGDYAAAARHFRGAIRHKPTSLKSWAYAVATHVPFRNRVLPPARRILRAIRGTWS